MGTEIKNILSELRKSLKMYKIEGRDFEERMPRKIYRRYIEFEVILSAMDMYKDPLSEENNKSTLHEKENNFHIACMSAYFYEGYELKTLLDELKLYLENNFEKK